MTPPDAPNNYPALDLIALPQGQRRVAEALIQGKKAQTYKGVAEQLGLSLGTVYEHLRRIRVNHPEVYAAMMEVRKGQLELRHRAALAKDAEHTRRYFKRRAKKSLLERLEALLRYVHKG